MSLAWDCIVLPDLVYNCDSQPSLKSIQELNSLSFAGDDLCWILKMRKGSKQKKTATCKPLCCQLSCLDWGDHLKALDLTR